MLSALRFLADGMAQGVHSHLNGFTGQCTLVRHVGTDNRDTEVVPSVRVDSSTAARRVSVDWTLRHVGQDGSGDGGSLGGTESEQEAGSCGEEHVGELFGSLKGSLLL